MSAPQSFVVGELISVEWASWTALEIEQGQLDHVDLELDTQFTAVASLDALRYTLPPALLTIGMHAVRGRVCSQTAKGEWTEQLFQITPIAPGLLRDFVVKAASVPVTPEQGAAMAHAYSTLAIGKTLTPQQLIKLASRFNGPQTRGGVLAFLDRELVRLTA